MRDNIEITADERARYLQFLAGEIPKTTRPRPTSGILWHYTSGDGLVGIVDSGRFWTTHISCVNDSTELRYASNLLLETLQTMRAQEEHAGDSPTHAAEMVLYDTVITGLSVDAAPISEWFVGCLSENGDDLSQWRAYGGGEGGYAIGFELATLVEAVNKENAYVVPVCYRRQVHLDVACSVAAATKKFYLEGLAARQGVDPQHWADVFLRAWANVITYLGPIAKHRAFEAEMEWRIIRQLHEPDLPNLEFQQKQSMLRRHLPLAFRAPGVADRLPIASVRVGPSRHKDISRVSVAALLRGKGYSTQVWDSVLVSDVPFQAM